MNVISVEKLKDFDKACKFSCLLFRDSLELIFNIIDGWKYREDLNKPLNRHDIFRGPISPRLKVKHCEIAKNLLELYEKNRIISSDDRNGIVCFPPVIQSGGHYTSNFCCKSDEHYFIDDVIILHLSLKYNEYCSSVIRTIVVTQKNNSEVKQTYYLLLKVQKFIISILKDDVCLGDVYQQGKNFLEKENPNMTKYLSGSFGSRIENEREDENFCIVSGSKAIAKQHMTFNVIIGFCNMYDESVMEKLPHTYSLWIGDSILVKKGRGAHIMRCASNNPNRFVMDQARQLNNL